MLNISSPPKIPMCFSIRGDKRKFRPRSPKMPAYKSSDMTTDTTRMPMTQLWTKLSIRSVTMKNERSLPNSASDTPNETLFRKSRNVSHRPAAADPNTGAAVRTVITTAATSSARKRRMVSSVTGRVDGPRENRNVK